MKGEARALVLFQKLPIIFLIIAYYSLFNYSCSRICLLPFGSIAKHSNKKVKKNNKKKIMLTMNLHRKTVRHAHKSRLHANAFLQSGDSIWFACDSRAFLLVTCDGEGGEENLWRESKVTFFPSFFFCAVVVFYYEDIDPNVVNWNFVLHFFVSIYYKISLKRSFRFVFLRMFELRNKHERCRIRNHRALCTMIFSFVS